MQPVVFAAGLDWLEALLPVLFVLFWIVSQVVNMVRTVAGRGRPRRPQPGDQVARPRPAVDRIEEVQADIERQIEEFRAQRAAQRAAQRSGQQGEQRSSQKSEPGRTMPRPEPPPRPQAAPTKLGSLGSHGGDIARHVREAFADDLEHRPSRLPQLGAAPTSSAAMRPPLTDDLVASVRDPAALRRLFLVRELLDRPVDRWS